MMTGNRKFDHSAFSIYHLSSETKSIVIYSSRPTLTRKRTRKKAMTKATIQTNMKRTAIMWKAAKSYSEFSSKKTVSIPGSLACTPVYSGLVEESSTKQGATYQPKTTSRFASMLSMGLNQLMCISHPSNSTSVSLSLCVFKYP